MRLSRKKTKVHRFGEIIILLAVLICIGSALISTHQLNESIDLGNRKIILNYGNQVADRVHDLFEQVDVSIAALCRDVEKLDTGELEPLQDHLELYEEIWSMDATGILYEDGETCLANGKEVVFENPISLEDVLSYSQKLSITRQNMNGEEMLIFAKPCQIKIQGRTTGGVFAAMRLERLEEFLGDYGYSSDSFLVVTQFNGDNVWKQENTGTGEMGNCFQELGQYSIDKKDSVLQMETRMKVAMDGTIAYTKDGQDYYMAYVPLGVNYWYLLVSARSDSIDLTELARQHFAISALLVVGIVVMSVACVIYLTQRNRSISRYNEQLQVATAMANQANKAKQANRAKQEFLAKVSHDIRTPLNGVIGMLTLAKEEYDNREKCFGDLDKATISAKYLLGLLNDILDMSQIESGKQKLVDETVDMKEILKEIDAILETSASEKGLSFEMDESALQHRYFRGDSLRLTQILMNLCSNSVKYTHSGGWIRLQVEEQMGTEKSEVIFQVQDNGEGIAEDKLETIFKPFEQVSDRRQGGVGLGLPIVRSFVEMMGGQILVESQVAVGSTFTVVLPLQVVDAPESVEKEAQDTNLEGVSILMAEDNEINAEIAMTLLKQRGAEVTLAKDGEAVVEVYGQNPEGTFDIILMDIQMPKLDGLEATKRIRGMNRSDAKQIPILSMTANAFQEQKEEMLQAGMNDFLYKPIEIDIVCCCIKKWIKGE